MKNFEKKETNLNKLINKLGKVNLSYTQLDKDSASTLTKERDYLKLEKEELEKRNRDLRREHKYLCEKIDKLQAELQSKSKFEKKFNQDINDLNQETQSLVEEIENWQT